MAEGEEKNPLNELIETINENPDHIVITKEEYDSLLYQAGTETSKMPSSGSFGKVATNLFIYFVLFLVTNFVNKYVLSVLEFKYPTLFQGWQTLVGFLMLRVLVVSRNLKPMLTDKTRSDVIGWIPGMILFAASVYSGSKGLANLSVPAFFALQNLAAVISYGGQIIITQKLNSVFSYVMMMLTVVSSIAVMNTDPQFSPEGYAWTGVHIIVTGTMQIYTKLITGRLKLGQTEKLYCSYVYCVILFAPSSYLLGDALEARKFPYLYFSKFWVGCILSGIFGVLLNLHTLRLQEQDSEIIDLNKITGASKILTAFLSYFAFDAFITANHAIWILVNLLAGLVVEDAVQMSGKVSKVSDTDVHSRINSFADMKMNKTNRMSPHLGRYNVLFDDYLNDTELEEEEKFVDNDFDNKV